MAWIRDTDEKAQRRPADIALLVVAGDRWRCSRACGRRRSRASTSTSSTRSTSLSGNMVGLAKGVYALGSIWAALVGHARAARHPAGRGSRGTARSPPRRRGASPRRSTSSSAPTTSRASGSTCGSATARCSRSSTSRSSPPSRSGSRRTSCARCAGSSGSSSCWCARRRCTSGAGFPADVLGGLLVGFAVAALVRVAFGSPGGQPSIAEVTAALTDMGYEVTSITVRGGAGRPRVGDGRRARER